MNTNSKRLGIYLAVMLLCTAVATTLKSIACVMHLEYKSGFFTNTSLVNISDTIIALTMIGMLSYLFVAERIDLRASFSSGATYVPTGVLGVATAFLGAKLFSYVMQVSDYKPFDKSLAGGDKFTVLLATAVGVLAFLSIAHHFLNAFVTEGKSTLRGYFAAATVMFCACYAILVYLDGTLSISDSSKVLRQTSFLLASLFFLYEARISLGREMWRIYTAFGLTAASVIAYTAIPAIITYYTNDVLISSSSLKSLASLEEYVILIALFIFIICRLCLTIILPEAKENSMIKMLGEYAQKREESATESYESYQEAFAAKQLSIFDLYGGEIPEEVEEMTEEIAEVETVEEKQEPSISDDAIYEAIFGKMPERPKEEDPIEEEPDDRAPEEVAEDLFSTLDKVLNENEEEN